MTAPIEVDPDTIAKAKGLYLTLVGLTNSPAEAVQILGIMHMVLWMNSKSDTATVDMMLKEYVADFKYNIQFNDPSSTLQ